MLRLARTAFGLAAALGISGFIISHLLSKDSDVEVASLDETAMLHAETDAGFLSKVTGVLPWVGGKEEEITRARALADRDALRRMSLVSFAPDAPEGWEKLEWNMFFQGKFGAPDDEEKIFEEAAVYLVDESAVYLRFKHAKPTGHMVADLLQLQRYTEKGGNLSDLEGYRQKMPHTIETIRATADGWSIASDMKFKHFERIQGVHFIVGKKEMRPSEYDGMKYYYGALGGGVVIKLRSDAPAAKIRELLALVDMDALNAIQDVPHPLVGSGLPEFEIDTPEEWLSKNGFTLKKVKREIPVADLSEEISGDEETSGLQDGAGEDISSQTKEKKAH